MIADAKSEEKELVRGYGADFVVERSDDFSSTVRQQFPNGVDALIDTAVLTTKCFEAIRDGVVYIAVRRLEEIATARYIHYWCGFWM